MVLISVFIKKLMKKVKISKNSTGNLDPFFCRLTSNSALIQMLLSVDINIILTLFLIYNSLILFSHKKSVQLSSYMYYIFFCSKENFSSQQKQVNVNYSHTRVLCLFFICTSDCQETKSNTCNQIEVLPQRDFRLKFFNRILYWSITMVS